MGAMGRPTRGMLGIMGILALLVPGRHLHADTPGIRARAPQPTVTTEAWTMAKHQCQVKTIAGWQPVSVAASEQPPDSVSGQTSGQAPGHLLGSPPPRPRASVGSARILGRYRHPPSGAYFALTRTDYPNPRAWRRNNEAFMAEVESGVVEQAKGFRPLYRRSQRLGRVPSLDLGFRQRSPRGREVVLIRFLFFRRYTLSLALRVPAKSYRRYGSQHRSLMSGFVPYFGPPDTDETP